MFKECKMISGFYYRGRADSLARLPANPSSAGAADPQDYNTYMNGYNSVNCNLSPNPDLTKVRKSLTEDLSSHIRELLAESVRGPADSITDVDRAILLDLDSLRRVDSSTSEAYRNFYNTLQKSRAQTRELLRAKQIKKKSEC